jgi:hypothetical protein
LSHKGKATDDINFNPDDPITAYTSDSAYRRIQAYTEMAKQVHGPDYDPSAHDIEGEIVMRAGGGKKHGRYWLGDSTIDTATTPTLAQIRASSTSSSPAIRQRPTIAQQEITALQVISVSFVVY